MKFIKKEFYSVSAEDVFTIIPIGDIHIGAENCDEKRLKQVCDRVASEPNTYWIGLGDYCDYINRKDPRFSPGSLAKWVKVEHLTDLAAAQRDRLLTYLEPIADKCLGMIEGNHETAVKRHYERDVYLEVVNGVKEAAGHTNDLALHYNGWLWLSFYKSDEGEYRKAHTKDIRFYLHHGFVGGKLAGAKALNMQRMLWTHDCDICLMGHSHNTGVQLEAVMTASRSGKVVNKVKYGGYCGTFLRGFGMGGSSYGEAKGYFPLPIGGVEVKLRPQATNPDERINMIMSAS